METVVYILTLAGLVSTTVSLQSNSVLSSITRFHCGSNGAGKVEAPSVGRQWDSSIIRATGRTTN